MRKRCEHARGRNLTDCGRICGSPPQICMHNLRNVEKMFQMINNAESQGYIVKIICGRDNDSFHNVESTLWKVKCILSILWKEWFRIFTKLKVK